MLIIIGPGVMHAVDVLELPRAGAELSLRSLTLPGGGGRFRLTRAGVQQWGGKESLLQD